MASKKSSGGLHRLSPRELAAAAPGFHADGGGLVLSVGDKSRTWVFRFTSPSGRRREMGLGVATTSSIAQAGASIVLARDLAHAARELLRRGVDPIDDRDRQRDGARLVDVAKRVQKARQQLTLARAARDYHERVIEPTRTTKHAAQWISSLENHIPAGLWHAPLADISAPALLSALAAIKPHERARNLKGGLVLETITRIRQRLDAVFEDAMFHGRCTVNPAAAVRRKMRETLPAKKPGKLAALDYRQAPAVLQRVRTWPGTAARCLEFAVVTASRTSEALEARWSEFDLVACIWTVPAARMKGGEAHTVYLPPRAVELLRGQMGQHIELVFPSPTKADSALSNMSMLVLLKRMGLNDRTTVHGLCRATFSTWANETGAARPDVVEACLAHGEANLVRAAYNRADYADERRALLAAWSEYLVRPTLAVVAAAS